MLADRNALKQNAMGTITAQILIGTGHPYHGGIIPTHALWLSENSRPAWRCHPFERSLDPKEHWEERQCVWIPTYDNMLEDGLLLAALAWSSTRYGVLNGLGGAPAPEEAAVGGAQPHLEVSLVNLANQAFGAVRWQTRAELNTDVVAADLLALRQVVKKLSGHAKAVVTVLCESSVRHQLHALDGYAMSFEVCLSRESGPDADVE